MSLCHLLLIIILIPQHMITIESMYKFTIKNKKSIINIIVEIKKYETGIRYYYLTYTYENGCPKFLKDKFDTDCDIDGCIMVKNKITDIMVSMLMNNDIEPQLDKLLETVRTFDYNHDTGCSTKDRYKTVIDIGMELIKNADMMEDVQATMIIALSYLWD